MTVAYDGTNYVGWQIQPNGESVQAAIERAILKLTGEADQCAVGRPDGFRSARAGAGRQFFGRIHPSRVTDSAKRCRSFWSRMSSSVTCRKRTPRSMRRIQRRRKRYRYVIHNTRTHNPFLRNYVWHRHSRLDDVAMHAAGQQLVGTYDFRSFESHWPNKATSVRTV